MADATYRLGKLRELNCSFKVRALLAAHVSMATTVIAYLAFTWSTVVLLGGYVTSLEKKDFWCLTVISLSEATRIFNDVESDEKLMSIVADFMLLSVQTTVDITKDCLSSPAILKYGNMRALYLFRQLAAVICTGILMASVMIVIFNILILVARSPLLFVALPAWRLRQHDYGVPGGDGSKASLVPALDIFYSLVLVQGVLYLFLFTIRFTYGLVFKRLYDQCEFPKEWGWPALNKYFSDIMVKCKRDPASLIEASLFSHASELVGSESLDKYNTGVRMLGTLAEQGIEELRIEILLSRHKIQKLITTMGWTHVSSKEVTELREHAARIVACCADVIHLAEFPGAIRCVSTLLETTRDGDGITSYVLVLQGLAILEMLALDQHNCREICGAPGLLPKIMAPIYSDVLIQDIKTRARAMVVERSFKVVIQLGRAPGKVGRRLRREISSNKQAVKNLERILDRKNEAGEELQLLAIVILAELALDSSINLSTNTKENLIEKQLQIFFADEGEQEPATKFNRGGPLRDVSGKMLAFLSKNKDNSVLITTKYNGIVDRLTEMLDAMNNIVYRTIAAEVLENLCTHCDLHKQHLKETLLPKVLSEIMRKPQREASQSTTPPPGDDEEKQRGKDQSSRENEEQSDIKELQEALLSLTLILYNLVGADSFAVAVQQGAPGDGAFVANLKTIVEGNCKDEPTANSLTIVKLCSQIAISMLQSNLYTAHFKDQKFVEAVSKALEIMSELESCILVTGTNYRMKKTVRPLLSELENELKKELELVG